MAVTLNKLIYDIKNIIRGGITSDDDLLDDRQVEFWIHNTRAKLIREDLNKGRTISDNITQRIACLDIEKVDASMACGVEAGCTAYRSTRKIPKPVETATEDLLLEVRPIDVGSRPFHLVPVERIPYIGFSPFKGINGGIKASLVEGYIFIFVPTQDRVIKKIAIKQVAADPTELAQFCDCSGAPCYTDDSEYPISEHMIEPLKQLIFNTDIKILASAPTDSRGDADHSVQTNMTK